MSSQLSDIMVIGDIYIINNDNPVVSPDKKVDNKPDNQPVPNIPEAIRTISSFKDRLKKDIIPQPSGAVIRPTAGELMAKEEPEIKKAADDAIRETLDSIPELVAAKKVLEEQKR